MLAEFESEGFPVDTPYIRGFLPFSPGPPLDELNVMLFELFERKDLLGKNPELTLLLTKSSRLEAAPTRQTHFSWFPGVPGT